MSPYRLINRFVRSLTPTLLPWPGTTDVFIVEPSLIAMGYLKLTGSAHATPMLSLCYLDEL
jgi:hypothetical protein